MERSSFIPHILMCTIWHCASFVVSFRRCSLHWRGHTLREVSIRPRVCAFLILMLPMPLCQQPTLIPRVADSDTSARSLCISSSPLAYASSLLLLSCGSLRPGASTLSSTRHCLLLSTAVVTLFLSLTCFKLLTQRGRSILCPVHFMCYLCSTPYMHYM